MYRLAVFVFVLLAGCSTADGAPAEPPCVAGLSLDCAPQYDPPTYSTIFARIFQPTCASGTGTCHTPDAAKGGLVFTDADAAYKRLLDGSSPLLVVPGDPSCSTLVKRVTSNDASYHMPPGPNSLTAGETCTIVRWIAAGAKR